MSNVVKFPAKTAEEKDFDQIGALSFEKKPCGSILVLMHLSEGDSYPVVTLEADHPKTLPAIFKAAFDLGMVFGMEAVREQFFEAFSNVSKDCFGEHVEYGAYEIPDYDRIYDGEGGEE